MIVGFIAIFLVLQVFVFGFLCGKGYEKIVANRKDINALAISVRSVESMVNAQYVAADYRIRALENKVYELEDSGFTAHGCKNYESKLIDLKL